VSPAGTLIGAVLLAAALGGPAACATRPPGPAGAGCDRDWPLWEAYAAHFISPEGRVIDSAAADHSTSEGQSYALFFALVANDRARFDALLAWTRANLAQGDLAAHLPAWRWGRRDDGSWGVLDPNAASDADLWLAYALIEGGRIWRDPALGRSLASRIVADEVRALPELGPTLLPGPVGFDDGAGTWRLNPSYLPVQLLRRFAALRLPGPWDALLASTARMAREVAPHGLFPDWVAWREGGFAPDPVHGSKGSYDAVRVYLWNGMLAPGDALAAPLAAAGRGMLALTKARGAVPEVVDSAARDGAVTNSGPVGFSGALLPAALRAGDEALGAALSARIAAAARGPLYGEPPRYFDHNLLLFGLGFAEGRYRFAADGALEPRWSSPCAEH
jgi:endoglucanase